jgi:hypothetical protein
MSDVLPGTDMKSAMRGGGLIGVTIGVFAGVFVFVHPIAQPQDYHNFADARTFFGIPRTWDVLGNVGFLLVGALGLKFLSSAESAKAFFDQRERWPYIILFAGIVLTCFGSGYYHLAPNDARLVWDRLPMTLGFMGLVSAIICERISVTLGLRLLPLLLVLGVGSVVYWRMTDDLRLYGLVQFYPALLIPLILWQYPKRYTGNRYLALAAVGYVLAKLFEGWDRDIFALTRGTVSGHTLKHLAAAWGVWWLVRMLQRRKPIHHGDTEKANS